MNEYAIVCCKNSSSTRLNLRNIKLMMLKNLSACVLLVLFFGTVKAEKRDTKVIWSI
jgi:hypothetical protein